MRSVGLTPEERKAREDDLVSKRAKKDEEKQRILEQAEADRKARVERDTLLTSTGEVPTAPVPTLASNVDTKPVKLQIRCPHFNRVVVFTSFTPDSTLSDCASALREELIKGICESESLQGEMASARVPTQDTFVFVETVPPRKRWVSPEDMQQSLRSAGLCPSSSLLAEVRPLEVPQTLVPDEALDEDEEINRGVDDSHDGNNAGEDDDDGERSSSDMDDSDDPFGKGVGKGFGKHYAPPQKGRHQFPKGGGQVLGGGDGTSVVGGADEGHDGNDVDEDDDDGEQSNDDDDPYGKGKGFGKGFGNMFGKGAARDYGPPPKRGHQFPEGSGQVLGRGDGIGAVGGVALLNTCNSSTTTQASNSTEKEREARDARLAALERRGLASTSSSNGQESLARQDPNRPKGQMGDGLNKEQRNKERDEIMQRIQEDRESYEIRKPRGAPVKSVAAQEEEETEVRLQVRCATSRRVHIPIGLKKDSLLGSVRDKAAASLEVEAPVLSLDYPPWTQFEGEQYEATLSALGLCPSATLRISTSATLAPAQERSTQCPLGHAMTKFDQADGWCDKCKNALAAGSLAWECKQCDFIICQQCTTANML